MSNKPQLVTLSQNEEIELMQNLWDTYDQKLMVSLKEDILSGPNSEIIEPSRRFYIKKDWSKY